MEEPETLNVVLKFQVLNHPAGWEDVEADGDGVLWLGGHVGANAVRIRLRPKAPERTGQERGHWEAWEADLAVRAAMQVLETAGESVAVAEIANDYDWLATTAKEFTAALREAYRRGRNEAT